MSDTLSDTADTPDTEPGITLAEAAARLGVSERTVLRRIEKGMLQAYKVDAERGQVWRVRMSAVPVTPAPAMTDTTDNNAAVADTPPAASPELLKVLEILDDERHRVDQLQAELREASNVAAHWQARAMAAEQTVQRLLPAPKDELAPVDATPDQPEQRRPWWQRWKR